MRKCKITVLKCDTKPDFVHKYMPGFPVIPCHCMKEGQEYITEGPFGCEIPVGFCPNAWESFSDEAWIIASGGSVRNSGDCKYVACCTDGNRPVTFLLEPYEDGTEPPPLPKLEN